MMVLENMFIAFAAYVTPEWVLRALKFVLSISSSFKVLSNHLLTMLADEESGWISPQNIHSLYILQGV